LAAHQQNPESEGTQGQPAGASSAELAEQQQKDAEALNIIRVLYAADVPGLKRKRGAAAQNQQHKVGAGARWWGVNPFKPAASMQCLPIKGSVCWHATCA
jgi:hypothetical protein